MSSSTPRLLVLVIEGITPALIERWAGMLPGFAALAGAGPGGTFHGLPVPYEPSAHRTMFAGYSPGSHGVFSFWEIHGERFAEAPRVTIEGTSEAQFLWDRPEAAHVRSAIVNVIGTEVTPHTRNQVITYPMYPTLRGCHPPDLLRRLARQGVHYHHDASVLYRGESGEDFFARVERVARGRMDAALHLLAQPADLYVVNLTVIERIAHFFWGELESGARDDEDTLMWRAYRLVDRFLIKVLEHLGPTGHVLVLSEFGFGPLAAYVSLDQILVDSGLQHLTGKAIDPKRTVAREAVQGSQGINLNLCRRYEDGIVPDSAEDACARDVSEALLAASNPYTGLPLIREVVRGRDLYPGTRSDSAPDLVVFPYDERYLPLGDRHWASYLHRSLQTGWHRRHSRWWGMGPRFAGRLRDTDACCDDVAATIADILALDWQPPCGRSLVGRGARS